MGYRSEKEWRIDVDNYTKKLTVTVLFGHEMCWDNRNRKRFEGADFWSGKSMPVIDDETKEKTGKELTPDITVFVSDKYGVIGEIKHGLPRDQKRWKKTITQLQSYDNALSNWSDTSDEVGVHDVVLLIPNGLRKRFLDYYNKQLASAGVTFVRNFAALSYHIESNASQAMAFECFLGGISDENKNVLFSDIHYVPLNLVLPLYQLAFCNEEPPLPYTMARVWDHIGSSIANSMDEGTILKFNLEALLQGMRELNTYGGKGQGCPTLPKRAWVGLALEALRKLKVISMTGRDEYELPLARLRRIKNPLDYFIGRLSKKGAEARKPMPMMGLLTMSS